MHEAIEWAEYIAQLNAIETAKALAANNNTNKENEQ